MESAQLRAGARQGKLALLSHCILNQNARAQGIAIHRGAIAPAIEMLEEAGYRLMQLPCPEVSFAGTARWWSVYEQYDSVAYRRHCANLAEIVAQLVKPYADKGCDVVLLGLGISPSCGVRMRQTGKAWRGRPFDIGDVASVEEGMGVWVQELEKALKSKGIAVRMLDLPPVLLYPRERVPKVAGYPSKEEDSWRELKEFLVA